MDVVSFFSTKKGQEITENLFYQKLSFCWLVGISLYFLSLEWPFISIMKTNNGFLDEKKMEMMTTNGAFLLYFCYKIWSMSLQFI